MSKSKKQLKTQSIYQLHKGGFKTHKTQEAKIFFPRFQLTKHQQIFFFIQRERLCSKSSELSIFSPFNVLAFSLSRSL